MLCHKYKCIYIHIPKAAGKSIQHVFAKQLGLGSKKGSDLLVGMNANPDSGPPDLSHLKASEYVQLGYLSQEKFDSYFKFSFVRNPWDRIVSEPNITMMNPGSLSPIYTGKILKPLDTNLGNDSG